MFVEYAEVESVAAWQSYYERVQNDPDFWSAIARYRELADIQFELWEVVELS